ncbi:hypothetical protein Nepgr_019015 [Nepenthes gracilis]|uniref:RNase H type-1 domain-containing protein n=1 Tax=Nepenthes gracilis TaxID=150966 RepID=A0AAD3XUK8_NEPGR|nr:hypothetical protein Nepgr_019015 [Nepenthes gracilis]
MSGHHVQDLIETFNVLKTHKMKLNPSKCTFGIALGKFLGYIVSHRGIKANPEKIKPEVFERLIKWDIELGEFDIKFHPRPVLKGQALVDFVGETTTLAHDDLSQPAVGELNKATMWTLHVDGSLMKDGCGASVVLRTPEGSEIKYSITLEFSATNNVAEYEALLAGLRLAKECLTKNLIIYSDSELVINQVRRHFEVNNSQLSKYLSKVKNTTTDFEEIKFIHISREENGKADTLARPATSGDQNSMLEECDES